MANPRDYSTVIPGVLQHSWEGGVYPDIVNPRSRVASRSGSDSKRRKPLAEYIPPTAYSMEEMSQVHPSGSWSQRYKFGYMYDVESGSLANHATPETLANYTWPYLGLTEAFPDGLANRALIKARGKLKSQDINLGQAFGERRQTAGLVSDSLRRIVRTVRDFRRANPSRWAQLLRESPDGLVKSIPNWWLEVVYGWKPLLSDIHGACAALDKRNVSDWVVTVKARDAQRAELSDFLIPSLSGNARNSCFVTANVFHGSYVRIDAAPSSDALRSASELGLTNPLSLAWELMPWSFVIDWALPLGPYFDQMDACLGWDILGFSQSNFTRVKYEWRGRAWTDGLFDYVGSWNSRRRVVRLNRSAGTTVPFPVLPSIKDPFNSKQRVGTALALLAGIFGR